MTLFDVASRKVINELQIQSRFPVKCVHWSHDFDTCALLSRFSVMLCDSDMNEVCTIYENAKVKSGQWTKDHVFIYTTVTHMKYALPSGDHGIIKTLDEVLYVAMIKDDTVICMNRDNQTTKIIVDNTEYIFKKALSERQYGVVQSLIESGKLRGESIISYLQKKGFPEVAMRFVKDTNTRFELALECGNIDDAFECALQINTEQCWQRFGNSALMQGNYQFVTEAYKKTRNFEKLMYLFLLTGDFPMMDKLADIAKQKDDKTMRYHISLFNGNVKDRISALVDSGQYGLAYLTAVSNGLEDVAAQMKDKLGDKNIILPNMPKEGLRTPPQPVFGPFTDQAKYDWPRTEITKGFFDKADISAQMQEEALKKAKEKEKKAAVNLLDSDEEEQSPNKDDLDFGFTDKKSKEKKTGKDKNEEEQEDDLMKSGWPSEDDIVVSEDENDKKKDDNLLDEKKKKTI
ncbi:hypothetical protein RFI_20614 [Reticulomyxa filosa]|uniref:Uncharacterized protein n=1 Tax=Reticulomyxa filosa TaxID=46433 RepID=X6MSA3_RETFI|nr:hypothetical protein RFI_20614 [Reticulomyxa filosa]|eukprot:ETO16724.1 hypothetical protein RFI_20614 [Reticulomyxa filosa]